VILAVMFAAGAGVAIYMGIQHARVESSIKAWHADALRRGWTPEYTHQYWLKCMGRVS
jgi:hypothetical protein